MPSEAWLCKLLWRNDEPGFEVRPRFAIEPAGFSLWSATRCQPRTSLGLQGALMPARTERVW